LNRLGLMGSSMFSPSSTGNSSTNFGWYVSPKRVDECCVNKQSVHIFDVREEKRIVELLGVTKVTGVKVSPKISFEEQPERI